MEAETPKLSTPNILPDHEAPASARSVADLCSLVSVGDQVTYKRTAEPTGKEPYFFTVKMMGEYLNNGLPSIDWPQDAEKPGEVRRGPDTDAPLSAYPNLRLRFGGNPAHMSHLYDLSRPLHVLSDDLYQFILREDPGSLEGVPLSLPDPSAARFLRLWLIRPCRILDAIDIAKTNVTIWRRAIQRTERSFTTVEFAPDFSISELAREAGSFMEKHTQIWLWSERLLRAAQGAGFYGFAAKPTWRRDFLSELRLTKPT